MSLASRTDALAFSVYRDNKYEIYATDGTSQVLNGTEPISLPGPASVLPPPTKRAGDWPRCCRTRAWAAGDEGELPVDNYKPKLGLDSSGSPRGGRRGPLRQLRRRAISFLWSDMLGNHSLLTALQIQSGVTGHFSDVWKDSGALVAYQDLSRRWNWGVSAQQMPYLSGGSPTGSIPKPARMSSRRPSTADEPRGFGGAGLSLQQGTEGRGERRFSNLGFSMDTRTTFYDPYTGQILGDDSTSQELPTR